MKKTVSNSIKGLEGKFESSAKFWSGPIENIKLASEGNFNVIELSKINFLKEKLEIQIINKNSKNEY